MPKFAANLSMMFTEVPFLDRFAAAKDAGFHAVEYLFPYDYSPDTVRQRLHDSGLENVLFNMPPGDWAAGERGITSIPGREAEFREGVQKALNYAAVLGVRRLHAMAGIPPATADRAACRATLVNNLRYAAEKLAGRESHCFSKRSTPGICRDSSFQPRRNPSRFVLKLVRRI